MVNAIEVPADLVLDGDGGGHQLEVVRSNATDHVLQRHVEGEAQVDLSNNPAELGGHRWLRLPDDHLNGL
jgi:hypothetical protein